MKDLSLPKCNLYLKGAGSDTNGNKVVKLFFPNQRSFSIQTNGNLPRTHSLLRGLKTITQMEKLTSSDLNMISKEVVSYVKKHGSELQRKKLRVYTD